MNGNATGQITYEYRFPSEESPSRTQSMMASVAPLVVSRDGKRYLVALRSQVDPEHPVILQSDLFPFVFNAEEERSIREKLERIF